MAPETLHELVITSNHKCDTGGFTLVSSGVFEITGKNSADDSVLGYLFYPFTVYDGTFEVVVTPLHRVEGYLNVFTVAVGTTTNTYRKIWIEFPTYSRYGVALFADNLGLLD